MIGGDLYVVQDTPHGVRVMVGDVRGKGLGAVSAVCADLGAFRYAADEAEDLPGLVTALERALLREGGRRGGQEQDEGFTTALIAEFAEDLGSVRVVNRGHPPPVLLDAEGRATVLRPSEEAPPLGMSVLGAWSCPVDTFPFPPGATLVCFTDGVTEARDESGVFYDASVRLPFLVHHRALIGDPATPAQILHLLIEDVGHHTGGRIQDDQASSRCTAPGSVRTRNGRRTVAAPPHTLARYGFEAPIVGHPHGRHVRQETYDVSTSGVSGVEQHGELAPARRLS